jgi:hypothetical protein
MRGYDFAVCFIFGFSMSIAAGAAATVEISRVEYEGKCATCHWSNIGTLLTNYKS